MSKRSAFGVGSPSESQIQVTLGHHEQSVGKQSVGKQFVGEQFVTHVDAYRRNRCPPHAVTSVPPKTCYLQRRTNISPDFNRSRPSMMSLFVVVWVLLALAGAQECGKPLSFALLYFIIM